MFMVSSLFLCASLTWIGIALFVRERAPRVVTAVAETVPARIERVRITPLPVAVKEYSVTINDANIVLGKNDTHLVVVMQP